MRTALLLSGHIRNLEENYDNLKACVLDKLQPDIFLHTWDTLGWMTDGIDIEAGEGKFKGFDHYSGKVDQNRIISLLNPVGYMFEDYTQKEEEFVSQATRYKQHCKHPKDRPVNVVACLYKAYCCNLLKQEHERKNSFVYDVVIRSRPDMIYPDWFDRRVSSLPLQTNILFTSEECSFDGASDIFAVGTSGTIDRLSAAYQELETLSKLAGINMNPHTLAKTFFDLEFPRGGWVKVPFGIDLNRCRKKKSVCGGLRLCEACNPNKKILSNINLP